MLYINWVYKGAVVVSESIRLEASEEAMQSLKTSIEIAWRYKTPRLYTNYAKPEYCDRFFISTDRQLNKWVG